jgi:hypothetical protein
MALEDAHLAPGFGDGRGCGQAGDAAADNDYVDGLHGGPLLASSRGNLLR